MRVWAAWNASHGRGSGCVTVTGEACGDEPNLAYSKPAWEAVWQRKEQFLFFLFPCAWEKASSDHPDSETNMSKFMFALQQNKGGHRQLCSLVILVAPKGEQNKLGSTSLLDIRVRQSPAGMKWCSSAPLVGLRVFCWGQSPHCCFPAQDTSCCVAKCGSLAINLFQWTLKGYGSCMMFLPHFNSSAARCWMSGEEMESLLVSKPRIKLGNSRV